MGALRTFVIRATYGLTLAIRRGDGGRYVARRA
jgi:hypothetical protein